MERLAFPGTRMENWYMLYILDRWYVAYERVSGKWSKGRLRV